ncbi:MAG: hypothetical protein JW881_02610 [Spirochaetales bacterium]|nr:hypothetical protein [Spirochaetales bacterium]
MKSTITAHTGVERKIKTDIIRKNTLRKELTREIRVIKRLSDLLQKSKNRQKRSKYKKDIERHLPVIRKNRELLAAMIGDLEKKIASEMKYSEKEMKDLEQTYKKEYEEMVAAQNLVLKAEQSKLSDNEKLDISGMSIDRVQDPEKATEDGSTTKLPVFPSELLLARANKRLKKESKDVANAEKEIDSEKKDKMLFEGELKRIALEKKILGR